MTFMKLGSEHAKNFTPTETALARMQSDIVNHLENKEGVIHVFLDIGAAFDSIDQYTLLHQ